jgi:DeoR/GlpR family transcriptional regulator of sugar metabolism
MASMTCVEKAVKFGLELTRERGRATIAHAVKVTGASRNTIKDHIAALAGQGHLIRHGAGRGT